MEAQNYLLKIYFLIKYFCFGGIIFLLIMIFYYTKKLKVFEEWKESFKNRGFIKPLTKKEKKWLEVEHLLKENYSSSWKLAIIEAYTLVLEALKILEYKGRNFKEIKEQLKEQGFRNLDILENAFLKAEDLIKNSQKEISQNEAFQIVFILKKFYNDLFSLFI